MNSVQRMDATFKGLPLDHLLAQPIIMTLAARHSGHLYNDYVHDYRILVESQLLMVEKFGTDMVTVCSDPAREAEACGANIRFFEDQPPAFDPWDCLIKDKAQLLTMKQPAMDSHRMGDRLEALRSFKDQVGGEVPILGWIEGPMAEASDIRGINEVMVDVVDDLEFVDDLFQFVTELEINYARAQVEAGADIIGIGDAASSLIGQQIYHDYVLKYEKEMVDACHEMGVPVRLHICGNINHLLDDLATLNLDMIDIDFFTDVGLAREKLGPNVAILGNAEPVVWLLQGQPDGVYDIFSRLRDAAPGKFVVGPGCEVPPDSPTPNVEAMFRFAREGV